MGFDVNDVPSFGRQAAYLCGTPVPNEAAPQPVAAQGAAVADGGGDAVANPAANSYNADLARILRNISRETWKAVGSDDIKALAKVTRDGGARERIAALGDTAAKVQSSLAKLAKYNAGEVGEALANAKGDVPGLLNDAVDGLLDISRQLFDIVNESDDDALRNACDELAMRCDSRASELMTLGAQMADIADNPDVLKGYDRLKEGNFVDIAKGMGGVMHDNYEAVARTAVKNDSVGKLMQDLEVAGQSADRENADKKTVDTFKKRIENLGQAISADGGRGVLTQEAAERIRAAFGEMSHRARAVGVGHARRFIESQRLPFADILEGANAKDCPLLTRMNEEQEKWLAALRKRTDEKPGTKAHKRAADAALKQAEAYSKFVYGLFGKHATQSGQLNLGDLKRELREIGKKAANTPAGKAAKNLRDMIEKAEGDAKGKGTSLQAVGKALYGCSMTHRRKDGWVKDMLRGQLHKVGTYAGESRACSLSDVVKSILDRTDMSKPLLATLYDVGADYVDDTLTDDKIVDSKAGASGSASATEILTYRTDDPDQPTKEIVFKPDFGASFNDKTLNLAHGDMYGREQGPRPLQLGIATYEFGKLLGCSDIVVKTTPLFHNGQLGLGMEKAQGKEAVDFSRSGDNTLDTIARMAYSDNPAERARFRKNANDLTDKTTAMQWLDLVCGQCDRHGGNFMVGFGGDGVSVKLIDNDMSFGVNRIGLTKMKLDETLIKETVHFMHQIVQVHASAAKPKRDDKTLKDDVDKWVRSQLKDGVLDFTSQDCPVEFKYAIQKATGVTALMVPGVMSRKMADAFLDLAADGGKKFDDFCNRLVRERLIASSKDNDTYVEDCLKATKNRFGEIVNLIQGNKLVLVDEPTEGNPTPWLDGKVVSAVKRVVQESSWLDGSMNSADVKSEFSDEYTYVRRLGWHPMYRFVKLLDPDRLSASMKK